MTNRLDRLDDFNISNRLPRWRIYWGDSTNRNEYHHNGDIAESIDELVESVDDVLRFWPVLRDPINGNPRYCHLSLINGSPRYCRLSLLAELGDTFLL